VDNLMAIRDPGLDPARRRLNATINVVVIRALLTYAQSSDEGFRSRLLAETKILLLAYVKEVFGPRALLPAKPTPDGVPARRASEGTR